MAFDLNQIIGDNEQERARERREEAKRVYESYSFIGKHLNIQSSSTIEKLPQEGQKQPKEPSGINSFDDALLLLGEVAKGKAIKQIHDESDLFGQMCIKKMHNIYNTTLLKLSKTFLSVLPKNTCQMEAEDFKKTYFKSPSMLAFYNESGLNMLDFFSKLVFLKKWLKQYTKYLEEGYGMDYLPENVNIIRGELPHYYYHINDLFQKSHFAQSKTPRKPKGKQGAMLERLQDREGSR